MSRTSNSARPQGLLRMTLRDFVIVKHLELDFATGFSVLTGETGAGKSILIDALQLVLGERAEASVIRQGAARADIAAEFALTPAVSAWLAEAGLDQGEDAVLLRRVVESSDAGSAHAANDAIKSSTSTPATTKSRAWINGLAATATQLRELAELLVDIHGQHAWQSLTRASAVRDLLDAYAQTSSKPVAALWATWQEAQQQLARARAAQGSLAQQREALQWNIAELEKLEPATGEWANLNLEHGRLANAKGLLEAAQTALQLLREAESERGAGGNAAECIDRALSALDAQGTVEPEFTVLTSQLNTALAAVQDTAHTLSHYLQRTDLDPERLQALDDRLGLWVQLARRFKRTPQELEGLLDTWRTELEALEQGSDLDALLASVSKTEAAFQKAAQALSRQRQHAAPLLGRIITAALQTLGMPGAQFEVALDDLPAEAPASYGLENVQFLVAGHAGVAPKPIAKVASGGELSRMALAISVTTSQLGAAPTLIFDEVDVGIGGAVAEVVGKLMRQLGGDRQVLSVTHLPQVAACAHQHLRVAKHTEGGQTSSQVQALDANGRVQELARMLGGEVISATTLAHAQELLGRHGAAAAA